MKSTLTFHPLNQKDGMISTLSMYANYKLDGDSFSEDQIFVSGLSTLSGLVPGWFGADKVLRYQVGLSGSVFQFSYQESTKKR